MTNANVFLSVGSTATEQQETFVRSVEDRLRSEGITPHTVGRNTFSSDAPLKTVRDLMSSCSGAVVIALERSYFPSGIEKRGGPDEVALSNIRQATVWNQIEATMAYTKKLPLLVIVEEGVLGDGLLERGYDWYVQTIEPSKDALNTLEFNGVLSSWKEKVTAAKTRAPQALTDEMTIAEILGGLKPAQLWSLLGAIATLVAGAFAVGAGVLGN